MLLLIFWTTLCAAQTSTPICLPPVRPLTRGAWELDDLNGRIKVVQTFKIWFRKDEQIGRLIRDRPRLEEEAKYSARGERTHWYTPNYPPYDPNNNIAVEYECDGPTRIKEIRYRRLRDSSFTKTVYGYDDKGRKVEQANYFADGVLERLAKYQYDDKENLIEKTSRQQVHPEHFKPKRHDVYVTTRLGFGYDSRRNKTSEILYSGDGSVYTTWIFEYDSRNRLIKNTRRDKLGRLEEEYFYKYDCHNRLVEEKHYANFCYTRNDEFCKGTVKSVDGVFYYLTRTTHEYDRRGNWVRQGQSAMGGQAGSRLYQPDHILTRRIIYYK